jgi:hypothetical protein
LGAGYAHGKFFLDEQHKIKDTCSSEKSTLTSSTSSFFRMEMPLPTKNQMHCTTINFILQLKMTFNRTNKGKRKGI